MRKNNKIENEHYRIDPRTGKRDVAKIAYDTKRQAYRYIRENYEDRKEWSVYKCLICGKFHIGHSNQISYKERYDRALKDIKFLKCLLKKRTSELIKLKDKLCHN